MKKIKVFFLLLTMGLVSCSTLKNKEKEMKAIQFRFARPTNQLSEIVKFYQEGLGLKVIGSFAGHDGYDGVMIGLPGTLYHLEFTQNEKKVYLPQPTKEHLMVLYFDDPEAYRLAVARLKGIGAKEVAPENPYWLGKSITVEDPDGWRIVLFDGVFIGKE